MRSDGTDTRKLNQEHSRPISCPTGPLPARKIAFYTTRYDENTSDIAVINPDGSNVRRLTYTTGLPGDEKFFSESYPEWSAIR